MNCATGAGVVCTVGGIARGDPDQISEATEKYYRDVYDHVVQLVDLTETYRDLARGAREIYLSTLSQSTNEVMKTLTVMALLKKSCLESIS